MNENSSNIKWKDYKLIFRVLSIVIKVVPFQLVLIFALMIISGSIPILQVIITKELVDSVTNAISTQGHYSNALLLLSIQIIVLFANDFIQEVITLVKWKMEKKVDYYFERNLMQKTSELPFLFFDIPENNDIIQRAYAGSGGRGLIVIFSGIKIVQSCFTLVGLFIVLAKLHWVLSITLLFVLIPHIFFTLKSGKSKYKFEVYESENRRRLSYYSSIISSRESAKESRLYLYSQYLIAKWIKTYWETENKEFAVTKKESFWRLCTRLLNGAISFIYIGSLIIVVTHQSFTIGDYVSLSQSLVSSIVLIEMIALNISTIIIQVPYLKDYFSFMSSNINIELKGGLVTNNKLVLNEQIEFENISFKYPNTESNVIQDISLSIKKGEKVVIVGENGSGKTTFIKCICGLYSPTEGLIRCDGKEIIPQEMTSITSAIFQDFVEYNLTLRENVALADISNMMNDKKIMEVLEQVNGKTVINKIGNLDSEVGLLFKDGKDVSGGEWQRIAIARAMFKEAEIIVLDEPTSALDPLAEAEILNRFYQVTEGKTSIIVTHRLGVCRNADKIVVFENGRISEIGKHDELVAINGKYKEMFTAQSQWYEDHTYSVN